jgi:uncharacterized protein with von Willebrand factor type A (vWA) domain
MAASVFLVILFWWLPAAPLPAQPYVSSEATEMFGIGGDGSRFVYVFDKSGSTEGAPLVAAKAELLKSLQRLNRVHQFQIVFYNHRPQIFSSGGEPRLFWAEPANKQSAEKFIKRISAGGGTNHLDALSAALRMNPDVVFLYTDAEEPRLSDEDLSRVRRLNRSATIHVIEFGRGAKGQRQGENFLRRLARQNAGQYRYLDLDEWLAERDAQ